MKFTRYWLLRRALHYRATGFLPPRLSEQDNRRGSLPFHSVPSWRQVFLTPPFVPSPHLFVSRRPPPPPAFSFSPRGTMPPGEASWGGSRCDFPSAQKQGFLSCERREPFLPGGSKAVSQPTDHLHCDSANSGKKVASPSPICPFSFKEGNKKWSLAGYLRWIATYEPLISHASQESPRGVTASFVPRSLVLPRWLPLGPEVVSPCHQHWLVSITALTLLSVKKKQAQN